MLLLDKIKDAFLKQEVTELNCETKDELITVVIDLIRSKKINSAYRQICYYEMNNDKPRGLGVNWNEEYSRGLSELDIRLYETLDIDLNNSPEYIETVKATLIASLMLGSNYKTMVRYITASGEKINYNGMEDFDTENKRVEMLLRYYGNKLSGDRELDGYKDCNIKKYSIIGTLDKITCSRCGELDGKSFLVSEAKVGVNFPPFHYGCRCTTRMYTKRDKNSERRARDPKTGKGCLVPGNMTYTDWIKSIDLD